MIDVQKEINCCGCGICAVVCPNACIKMGQDENGFRRPYVDKTVCSDCNVCMRKCPVQGAREESKKLFHKAYACKARDVSIQNNSSSGGVFSVFAEYILDKGGVVFGAAFDEKFCVKHIGISNSQELEKLMGSKYVESTISREIYLSVKKLLGNKCWVLFSGTPCQVAALTRFLGKKYETLMTVEVICHGVPGQRVYRSYLDEIRKRYNADIKSINFRSKIYGWKNFSTEIVFKNGKKLIKNNSVEQLYMRGFLRNLYNRESCSDCKFRIDNTYADFTIGDFWRLDVYKKDLYDKRGVSLVVCNSHAADLLLGELSGVYVQEVSFEFAKKCNPVLGKSNSMNPQRQAFFKDFRSNQLSHSEIMRKYMKVPFVESILARTGIKSFLKKILKK